MDKAIVITGISGFVGTNLEKHLSGKFNIQGVSRGVENTCINYDDFFENNIQYDSIVHLAGKAHDLKKTAEEGEYYEVNYELTKKLYSAFLKSNAKKFIYISSVKAVKDSIEGVLYENEVPNPLTVYGKSKRMAEEYILNNLPLDKQVYILRPCMIHGPGNKGNLNMLYAFVAKGIPFPLAAFHNQRSFLSIENLSFIIEQLLLLPIPSGIYNVADEVAISTNEIIKLISESLNKKTRLLYISKILIVAMAKFGDLIHLPLNTERLKKLTEDYVVSNRKIIDAIGMDLPVSAREGLLKTFHSFKKS